jgi:hypothetical protein
MLPTSDIIPRHATVMVGGGNSHTGRYYVLLKDEQLLVVQATPCYEHFFLSTIFDEATWEYLSREHEYGIEIIQSLLNVVEFGRSNWSYLVNYGGTYRLIYKDVPVRHLSCPTWATLVDEGDVQITQWVSGEQRHGLWRGREVDLLVAWGEEYALSIENNTRGHRLLLGLDLTFEVLGHILRDGRVVGLMTEPAYGRLMDFRDRSLVYEAIAKLQKHGILYKECHHAPNIMISDGKVRFLQTVHMRRLPPVELAKEAEYWHWKTLEDSFNEIGDRPNIYAATCHRHVPPRVKIIPQLPSLQRSITPSCYLFILELNFGKAPRPRKRTRRRNCRALHLATSDSAGHGYRYQSTSTSDDGEDDAPLEVAVTSSFRGRAAMRSFRPYDRASRVGRNLAWFEASETSSISEMSSLEGR